VGDHEAGEQGGCPTRLEFGHLGYRYDASVGLNSNAGYVYDAAARLFSQLSVCSQDDVPLGAWEGSLDNDPAEFGLTSVWNHTIYLANLTADTKVSRCPDRPLQFTRYTLVRRTQTELTIPNFQFPVPASNAITVSPHEP
jgi:hypothetical protein